MSPAHQSVVIDLERIFAAINAERKVAGLPQIEHAVMRVRMNIRLAIKGQDRIEGKLPVVLSSNATDELARVLNELFQTSFNAQQLQELSSNQAPVESAPDSAPSQVQKIHSDQPEAATKPIAPVEPARAETNESLKQIYLVDLYIAINQSRRQAQLPPIEPAVISVRLGVRFSILRRRRLDFGQASLEMSPLDLDALQSILIEQFDVNLPGGTHELVVAGLRRQREKPRKLSWLERVFHKRVHRISVPALIMAVMRQRASLGYKPLSPALITAGCQETLGKLGIQFQPGMSELILNDLQMDQLAEFLRNEYGLYFEDLEAFIDPEK
ncbi:MAG: hypothetical protein B7X35_04370 [Halothiobacillus sp. 14-56-357]|uniref:hypothetical protein n=1 Tax=Halothiobacillus sp. 15-55-196 TaxID=1970382 RepID=UPI000BC63AFE|nr:hypothetical protein [Halothiobacillus sp. 15-55-196]OZB37427.1 MAG: hypothetical protein B7X44_01830 [Halothiobacillus sp. 15-55-196]OZB56735.1 MAG: hypothetical protein B7X35_04370 [Halothiobacillus sp. 14-56-357]OZB77982.1 MAG: hypothetical protein B7X29_06590 [Halothiobacillus sp. 13-55-115]